MNKDYTDITIILDRSGSTQAIQNDVIGGINTFINSQKEIKGKCTVSLYQFDDKYEINYENCDINLVPELSKLTYIPRGWTALLDAIGKTIVSKGEYFSRLPEVDRPAKILFIIQTDGLENRSKEYTSSKIKELIIHQTEKYKWNFVFLGANQDACLTANTYGISSNSTLTYAANSVGTQSMYQSLCSGALLMRKSNSDTASVSFTDNDRKIQDNLINNK